MLKNLPTSDYDKDIFSQSVDKFREIHSSLASSSKFKPIPSSDNISMRRIRPWFSPSKMKKSRSIHKKRKSLSRNLNSRVEENENFQFPSIGCKKKKKKKKVTNRSNIAIQEERDIIRQQGECIFKKKYFCNYIAIILIFISCINHMSL